MYACPNCTQWIKHHPQNGCVLLAFIECLRERGDLTERQLFRLHAKTNPDVLWDQVGPIIDRLGEGEFLDTE